ncbi:uncharacterized protein RCO7_08312 [Rhynchosporium graminicola]|uniref:Uncharacterized protein n=1 Tax=Rhynchosporium graminicola TaxID=2792576 RepID=A0A1E1KQQ4_9HELO|nr:uncharacterized protein RCO7_08312 [Rhynchosporium commune]
MSAPPQSSNPFRRKAATNLPSAMSTRPSTSTHASSQNGNTQENAGIDQISTPKKVTKKVRVKSPPPLSPSTPSMPDSSTFGEDTFPAHDRLPSPPVPRAEDPFDSVNSEISEDDGSAIPSKAPANPFSRTLDTMEHPKREATISNPTPNIAQAGRASMDVAAFSRLLMTGDAGLNTPPAQPAAPPHAHTVGDRGCSTDTSSISRQSIFEAVQGPGPLLESPRTSHEILELEDEGGKGLKSEPATGPAPRVKPLPPSSRHGKLIKVVLRDERVSNALQSPPTPGITSQHYFSSEPRSQTDLNKPLPPAPTRASHDWDRESVFDKESAGKTPEPPSPSTSMRRPPSPSLSLRRKNPPAPPLARRHSQMISDSMLTRDPMRLLDKSEEESYRAQLQENRRPSADSIRAPPPPPSRRPGSVHRGLSQTVLKSPSTVSLPTPPPARGSSRSISGGKPPSVSNLDLSSTNVGKRTPNLGPPPPPPRHGRRSMDAPKSPTDSQRRSGEYFRQSIESARRGSSQYETTSEIKEIEEGNRHDILADLSKLQQDIDALRQAETGKIT